MKQYDDPYRLLALYIISENNVPEIYRIMTDKEYVKKLILKETRSVDFIGHFLDVVVESILTDKRRMEMMNELDKLGEFFWNNFDFSRLKAEIKECCELFGIVEDIEIFSGKDITEL